jgi:DNA polymerase
MEGMPFIGRSGHLLDKMLESINLSRKSVYITNVVNYRPPENRSPTEEEIQKYIPFLIRHIEIINPKILLLLGSTALNTIIGNDEVISNVRGKWIEKEIGKCKTSIIASFHPAFLIRQPTQKAMSWVDLKMIRKKILDLKINIEK